MPRGRHKQQVEARLWSKVSPCPETGCWLWAGAVGANGYGRIWLDGKMVTPHRLALSLATGEGPEGRGACHKCDIPLCVNPAHLYWGTQSDNVRDAVERRGFNAGENSGHAILTWERVRAIRAAHAAGVRPYAAIAAQHGVSVSAVGDVIRGATWREVQ